MKKLILFVTLSVASLSASQTNAGDFSVSFYGGLPGFYAPPVYYARAPYYYGGPAFYNALVKPYGYGRGYRSGFGGYGPSYYAPPRGGVEFGSGFGGNVEAKYLIVEMFDYTCDHCRNTHDSLKAAAPLLNNELAVLALPVPLHQSCNDAATNNSPERADACEIARLAISVWLIDAAKFTGFHDWLFEQKRTAADARTQAESLVGRDALVAELAKGTAAKYIGKNVTLYKEAGAGTVPKISFPRTTVIGEMGSAGSVAELVRQQFGQ